MIELTDAHKSDLTRAANIVPVYSRDLSPPVLDNPDLRMGHFDCDCGQASMASGKVYHTVHVSVPGGTEIAFVMCAADRFYKVQNNEPHNWHAFNHNVLTYSDPWKLWQDYWVIDPEDLYPHTDSWYVRLLCVDGEVEHRNQVISLHEVLDTGWDRRYEIVVTVFGQTYSNFYIDPYYASEAISEASMDHIACANTHRLENVYQYYQHHTGMSSGTKLTPWLNGNVPDVGPEPLIQAGTSVWTAQSIEQAIFDPTTDIATFSFNHNVFNITNS